MPTDAPLKAETTAQFQDVLGRFGARERATVEKHLALCDAEPDSEHGKLWRRLAAKLGSLAPLPVQTAGAQAVMFFIPDGKYRMQVFALEDKSDGVISLYLPDVMTLAIKQKIVSKSGEEYAITGARNQMLSASAMDAATTHDPPQHLKNMIGWNRKAVKVTLSTAAAGSPQVIAAEALCTLASKQWAAATPAK